MISLAEMKKAIAEGDIITVRKNYENSQDVVWGNPKPLDHFDGLFLKLAIKHNQDHIAKYLISKGVHPLVWGYTFDPEIDCYVLEKDTALHIVVKENNLSLLKEFISILNMDNNKETSEGINTSDGDGNTPLHLACQEGNWQIARLLIKNGANPEYKNKKDHTADDVRPKHWPSLCKEYRNWISTLIRESRLADLRKHKLIQKQVLEALSYIGDYDLAKISDQRREVIEYLCCKAIDPTSYEVGRSIRVSPLYIAYKMNDTFLFESLLWKTESSDSNDVKNRVVKMYPSLFYEECDKEYNELLRIMIAYYKKNKYSLNIDNIEQIFEKMLYCATTNKNLEAVNLLIKSEMVNEFCLFKIICRVASSVYVTLNHDTTYIIGSKRRTYEQILDVYTDYIAVNMTKVLIAGLSVFPMYCLYRNLMHYRNTQKAKKATGEKTAPLGQNAFHHKSDHPNAGLSSQYMPVKTSFRTLSFMGKHRLANVSQKVYGLKGKVEGPIRNVVLNRTVGKECSFLLKKIKKRIN